MILVILVGPVLLISGFILTKEYLESGNFIFRVLKNASENLQEACKQLFFTGSLLKLDLQLGGSCLILWLRNGFSDITLEQYVIISVGIFTTFLWILIGFLCVSLINNSHKY